MAAGAAFAQPAARPAGAAALEEVVVTATRVDESGFELPVSIDRVDRRAIREDQPRVNLSETLNRVPGVVVQNRQNYAQDLQVSSRGFGARSTFGVRGVRLIADGIPATMPDGQGQTATFSLGSADRIEVLRGPFSSLYGNAAGGVIQILTADGPPRPTVSGGLIAGSYDTWKLATELGGTSGHGGYLADLSHFETGGYRDHSAARRDHLNAKVKSRTGAGAVTLVVNSLDQPEAEDPLGLTAAQVVADRRQAGTNALAFNTRKSVTQTQLGVTWDHDLSAAERIEARAYGGDRQVTQYLAIPLLVQAGPRHSGGVVDLDRGYGGIGLRFTRTGGIAGGRYTASVGVDHDRMDEHRVGLVNDLGVAGAVKRNEDNTVASTDIYAQAQWRIGGRWTLLAGLRHSRVEFESTDYFITAANPNDSGSRDYSRTSSALGVSYEAIPALSVYASAGRGFETPTFAELAYRPDGATGLNFALQPALSIHRELGAKARIGERMRANVVLFRADVTDEIVVDRAAGGRTTYKNASKTRREGIEFEGDTRLGGGFEAGLAWTLLDARFEQAFTSGAPPVAVREGNRLPGVPPRVLHGGLAWRHAATGFHAGVEGRHSGKIYVNDANTAFAPAYTVWNLRAGFEQRGRDWRISEFARIDNVTGTRYIGSVIVSEANARYYEPAPTRNFLVGVQASLRF
ncbi:MAG: TonB-dependent receptor [Burkholderiales bacterium]|nr:TonB-dependent receptor [Burkholderiales bacterium]